MNSIIIIGSAIIITVSLLSIFFNVMHIFGQEQLLEQQGSNNSNYNYSDYNKDINAVIGEGLQDYCNN